MLLEKKKQPLRGPTNLKNEKMKNFKNPIQIILRQYKTIAEILYGFDVGSSQIGYNGFLFFFFSFLSHSSLLFLPHFYRCFHSLLMIFCLCFLEDLYFAGKTLFLTELSSYSFRTGCNIIDTSRLSPTYEVRMKKYWKRQEPFLCHLSLFFFSF